MARQLMVDDLVSYDTFFFENRASIVRDSEAFLPVCVDGTLGELTTTMRENALYLYVSDVKFDLDYAYRSWEYNDYKLILAKDGTCAEVSKKYVIAGGRGLLCSHPKYLSNIEMKSSPYMEPDDFGTDYSHYIGIFCENGIAINPPNTKNDGMKLNRLYVFSNDRFAPWRDDIKKINIDKLIFFEKNPAATDRWDQTIKWENSSSVPGNIGDLFRNYRPPKIPFFVKDKRVSDIYIKHGSSIVKPSSIFIKQDGAIKKIM